jgi:membrane protease YdiL (CAAX protease family)
LFILASFIIIGIAIVYSALNELNLFDIYNSFMATDFTSFTPEILKASAITQGYGNLISYIISCVLVVVFLRKFLVEDAIKIKENPMKFVIYSLAAGLIFIIISLGIDIAFSYLVESSQNQNNIEMIMSYGGALPMVLAVVIFAPIVEELIYRKSIFKLFENSSITACYVASIIFFTLPHMLSTDMSNIFTWFLQCIPYAACGFMLCFIYHKSNHNIYAAIIAHMMNNLLAAILMFI